MYKNIGGKIKKLAVVFAILGMIVSIAGSIIMIIIGLDLPLNSQITLEWSSLITIVVGCLASWLVSFLIYGFGELIERTVSIDNKLKWQQ